MTDERLWLAMWVSACSYGFLRRFPTELTNGERAFKSGHSSVHYGAVLSHGQMKSLGRGWSVVTSVRSFDRSICGQIRNGVINMVEISFLTVVYQNVQCGLYGRETFMVIVAPLAYCFE